MSVRRPLRILFVMGALGEVLSSGRLAAGQPVSAQTRAAAQELFDEGVRLLGEKRYAEACPKLAEVVRLYPGIGARLKLAACYEGAGMFASAWTTYDAAALAAARADDAARAGEARKKADAMAPRRAFLILTIPAREQQMEGLEVRWGTVVISRAQWNTPIPVDPGDHRIHARATGRRPWQADAHVEGEGAQVKVVVGPLLDEIRATAPEPLTPEGGGLRTAGFVLGGLGLAGVTVGIVTGALAIARKDEAEPLCPDRCTDEGTTIRDEGRAFGYASTATFIGGAALVAGGTVLVLAAPKSSAAALRARGTTLELTGRW